MILQETQLLLGFHTLGHHLNTQVVSQVDHRPGNHRVVMAFRDFRDKRAVDFQQVNGEIPKVTERRITHPEVINGKVNKYNANPGIPHFKAQKHECRFINGTRNYGIEFNWFANQPEPIDGPLHIIAYSDSSFADDVDTGRTTLGFVIQVNGATVSAASWLSPRVDSCVNHSELNAFGGMVDGTDGEFTDGSSAAMVKMGRTITWIRGIKAALEGRDPKTIPPTPCLVDNNGVLSMLKDITIKTANRHIFRSLAENRERVNLDKIVVPCKVDTKDNLANAMTKQERAVFESAAQLRQIAGPCTL